MSEPTILVLGGTGTTGRRVAARLRAAGAVVRAASRHGAVRFDWSDPDSWPAAVDGATGLYLMAPHGMPVEPAFVQTAVDRGVRRVVLLSSRGIEAMGDERLLTAERTVRESGAGWTILRPDWFNQNFDEGFFRPAVLAGRLAVPVGQARQVFVDADDIAAVAATVLTEAGHDGRSYDLTGPEALSFGDAVEIIAKVSGRPVTFAGDPDDYLAQQSALGMPEAQTRGEIAAFGALRDLGDQQPTDVVQRLTGRPPKDFPAFAVEAAARGAWT
jgi:uncharacterized protein YbjT (DUF2867 family)